MLIKFLLNGKQINLTSDNTVIKSNNFNVDKNGNMSCNNGNFSGDININAGETLTVKDSNNNKLTVVDEGGIRFFDNNGKQSNTISRTADGTQEGISLKTSHGNSYVSISDRNNTKLEYNSNLDKIQIFCLLDMYKNIDMHEWDIINCGNVVTTSEDNPTVKKLDIVDSSDGTRYLQVASWGNYIGGVNIWTSDGRLKENIQGSNVNALDIIKQIKHRQFDWKNSPGKHEEIGYIAQEIKEVNEKFVLEVDQQNNEKLLQINETKIIPYLTKSIQEQQEEIEYIKRQMESQEQLINELLKSSNVKLENRKTIIKHTKKENNANKIIKYGDIEISINSNKNERSKNKTSLCEEDENGKD